MREPDRSGQVEFPPTLLMEGDEFEQKLTKIEKF